MNDFDCPYHQMNPEYCFQCGGHEILCRNETMTNEQRDIILHSLGLTRSEKPFRNHYCDRDGDPKLEAMVTAGWMRHGSLLNEKRDRYYHVTESGAEAVGAKLPKEY